MSTRIYLLQICHTGKGIGAVAASAAAHLNLCQHPLATLKDGNIHLWHHLLQVYGKKESCRTATYHRCRHYEGKGTKNEQGALWVQ
jgi:hypothetical protein